MPPLAVPLLLSPGGLGLFGSPLIGTSRFCRGFHYLLAVCRARCLRGGTVPRQHFKSHPQHGNRGKLQKANAAIPVLHLTTTSRLFLLVT
jgi:hypothetical protein